MPFLRHARDKRGYETTFVMHSFRPGAGQAAGRTRLLYMFRTPSNRKVGRNLLDPEVMEALEHTHPDLTFDWTALLRTPALTAPDPDRERSDRDRERDRDRGRQRRDERRERQGANPDAKRESAPTAPPPQVILEDDSTLGRTLGAAEAARLRAAFSELTQRIVRRSRTPEERDRLTERAARLNPDDWADEPSIKDRAALFGVELEAIRQELPRRRRGRRGGRSRDRDGASSGAPSDIIAGDGQHDETEPEMESSAHDHDAGDRDDVGAGHTAAGADAAAESEPDGEIHKLD